jgi:creatinine amidohydrolase
MQPGQSNAALGPMMAEMTWQDVSRAVEDRYVPVLLVGATEQHGPHLPLATDTVLPLEVIKAAARTTRLLIAPPVPFGFKSKPLSGGGQGFPGTMSLDGSTLISVVRDLVSELARHGFRQMVVFNWHMENVNFVYEGIDQARAAGRLEDVTVMSIDSIVAAFPQEQLAWLFEEGFPGWDVEHAAIMETSLMLASRPELVRPDRVVDDQSEEHPWYDLLPAPASHIPKSGTLSLATLGTREKGERLQAMLVAKFVEALQKEFDVPLHAQAERIAAGVNG